MVGSDDDISWGLVLVLLVPALVVLSLMGYVIYDSIAFGAPRADAPDDTVLFSDHPDEFNRTSAGEGILNGTLRGAESVQWRHLALEIVDPRAGTTIATLEAPNWFASGAGQSVVVQVDGRRPDTNDTLQPGESFVLQELDDDFGDSSDLIDPCQPYVFRMVHQPSDTVIGRDEVAIVSDGVPGQPCEPGGS